MTPLFTPLTVTELELLSEQIRDPDRVLNPDPNSRNLGYEKSPFVFDPSDADSEFGL